MNKMRVKKNCLIKIFKIILYTRLFFGFDSKDLFHSTKIRSVAFVYCVVAGIMLSLFFCSFQNTFNDILLKLMYFEFILYYFLSLFINVCPLNYFEAVLARSHKPRANCLMLKILLASVSGALTIPLILVFAVFTAIVIFDEFDLYSFGLLIWRCIAFLISDLIQAPTILNLGMLVCDIKIFHGFVSSSRFCQNIKERRLNFCKLYDQIHNDFEKVVNVTKFFIACGLCVMIPRTLIKIYYTWKFIKSPKEDVPENVFVVYYWLFGFQEMCTAIAPLILLEIVASTEERIVIEIFNKRMVTADKHVRDEMRRLANYMRSRSLKFTLWRIIPLDARLVLGVASLCVTYSIIVLQMLGSTE